MLFIQSPEGARATDMRNVLNQAPCSLGAAAAAAKILSARAEEDRSLAPFAGMLRNGIDSAWRDVETWADSPDRPGFADSALSVRVHCINLGVRAAFSAVVATGGNALKRDRDAQRIYREAMTYAVAPQTAALKRATLARLLENKSL